MEITVSARHTDVSAALRQAVEEKIGKLSRYLEGMDRAEVHFTEERNPRIADKELCEVTLEGHGHHVRCKVAAPDGFAALDVAVDKLEGQLHKLKSKLQRRPHTRVGQQLPDEPVLEVSALADEPKVVKTKRHSLRAMTVEEAMLQLDMVDHDFWFFTNAATDRAAVLYRRADGDLGLIDDAGVPAMGDAG